MTIDWNVSATVVGAAVACFTTVAAWYAGMAKANRDQGKHEGQQDAHLSEHCKHLGQLQTITSDLAKTVADLTTSGAVKSEQIREIKRRLNNIPSFPAGRGTDPDIDIMETPR